MTIAFESVIASRDTSLPIELAVALNHKNVALHHVLSWNKFQLAKYRVRACE